MLAKKALGCAPAAVAEYVEDVFSTYLYTGNGSTQTITNNIDISGEGGMVWIRRRGSATDNHLENTVSGATKYLISNTTNAEQTNANAITSFNSTGFSLGSFSDVNSNNGSFVSWTFREAEKFFDVVTFTGTGSNSQVNHNLGSTPGCIIVKNTSATQAWYVYHRSLSTPADNYLVLNTTAASASITGLWGTVNSTQFGFSGNNGENYVAYLFAHDAGGFGDAGDQSVIKCGSYTGNGSATGPTITLGYEPQWVLIKQATDAGTRWTVTDNMRGFPVTSSAGQQILQPNVTDAEVGVMYIQPTATGFKVVDVDADVNTSGKTYIYIAIRRGPMKTPEVGTDVFVPIAGSSSGTTYPSGIVTDSVLALYRPGDTIYPEFGARLLGTNVLTTSSTAAQTSYSSRVWDKMNGAYNFSADSNYHGLCFRRAPGFFDVVCYTGTGSNRTVSHNLGVAPELIIVKRRSTVAENWAVYSATTGNTKFLRLNSTLAATTDPDRWNNTSPTSSVFTVGIDSEVNASGETYVSYLFGSVTGVSKVGSYTGTGTTLQVNCGFTGGARFVLIKRTDSTGDWYVWDTARGIVSGNDPYLLLNSTAAEVTNTDYIDTYSSGFEISSTAPAAINANGATYIYLSIA
jgi:hypothetical protein